MNKWGKLAVYGNDFTANMSLKDAGDYSLDMTNSISVNLSKNLALKVSLQGLFEHEPALEDVDVVTQVQLRDPDDIPGSGDEFFETVESGGARVVVDSGDIRRDQLDTVLRTSHFLTNFNGEEFEDHTWDHPQDPEAAPPPGSGSP
jgi:hypothetical protein